MSRAARWRVAVLAALAVGLLLGSAGAAAAVSSGYTLAWYTVDGGGGTTGSGALRVSGTLGQPDAGALGNGGYTLQGGFWASAAYRLDLPVMQKGGP